MDPTAAKKKIKKMIPRTIRGELSSHEDMLRTRYPKRYPTYLVAFSLKETYEDLATAQQMICKHSTPEHSPQQSNNSITPTGSSKILETEFDNLSVNAKNSTAEHSPQESTNSLTPTGSLIILDTDSGKSNIKAKTKQLCPKHSPQERTKSIPTTGSFNILKTELDELTAKSVPSSPGHSPHDSINSMASTGSFEIFKTELDESNILIAKSIPSSPGHSPHDSINSITPTGSFKIFKTELDESNIIAKNISSSPGHSPHDSINSITPTGSFKIFKTELDESNIIAKNISSSPGHSPHDSINSITPTGSFKIFKTELDESNIIAKNISSRPGHSPHDSINSITPTGSFKIFKTELDKSNINAKTKYDHNLIRKNSPESITPKNSLKELETEPTSERNQILDKKRTETIPVSIENSVHSSIYFTNSSTPTSSLKLSSSDYSTGSRITIGERQKVNIDFTAFATNSDEQSSIECTNVTENALKCDVLSQNSKRPDVVHHEQKDVGDFRQNKENVERYITVYVYDEVDHKSDKNNTSVIDNTGFTVNTVDSCNTGDTDNTCNDEEVNCVSDKINEDTNLTQENRKNNKEPESIFKAVRKNRATRKKRSFKRKSNNDVNIKQKKFKCKLSKKKIDARLEKYYENRKNSIDAYKIQFDLYSDEVSTVVSRTQVVRKKARENLLENSDLNTFASDFEDERYLSLSFSTARKPLISASESGQNTLVQEYSAISNVTDILNVITLNNDIEVDHVSSLLKMANVNDIYKSEVVSIPVTVAYDRSTVAGLKNENHSLTSQETSEELLTLVRLPLTSCEEVLPLISSAVSDITEPSFDNVTIKPSSKTLINMNSSVSQLSSSDFYNARTSSQFSKCLDSYSTLTNDKNTVIDVESRIEDSVLNKEAIIFETVINLDRYDQPSTSSSTPSSNNLPYFNDIIVANVPNDKHSTYRNHSDNKEEKEKENNRKTILTKTTDQPTEKVPNKILNLPNQMEIKAMLREREVAKLKCGDEMRNPPTIPPLWERLMSALEMAVHKLEDNLVEKIMKEIQKSVVKYPEHNQHISELITKAEQAATTAVCESSSVQCDLVKSTTIDKIMGKLSSDELETPDPKDPSTLNKVDMYNDLEVIISPDTTRTFTEKGDHITISTLTSDSLKLHHHLSWLASVPVRFIRENMLVITSVPTFFVFLLCLYGLIQFLMRPLW